MFIIFWSSQGPCGRRANGGYASYDRVRQHYRRRRTRLLRHPHRRYPQVQDRPRRYTGALVVVERSPPCRLVLLLLSIATDEESQLECLGFHFSRGNPSELVEMLCRENPSRDTASVHVRAVCPLALHQVIVVVPHAICRDTYCSNDLVSPNIRRCRTRVNRWISCVTAPFPASSGDLPKSES